MLRFAHAFAPGAELMEFIEVRVKNQPLIYADVLINGRRNGKTAALITLGGPGWIFVSVDYPGARQQNLKVKNTTASHPMNIEIECDGSDSGG
jgi:hypothetical protein